MITIHQNIKFLIIFSIFSTQLYSLFGSDAITHEIPSTNTAEGTIHITSQILAKNSAAVDARTIIVQGGLISDIFKIFDPNNIKTASKTFKIHYFKIIAGSLLASYMWILYQIRFTCLLMKQHDAWCNWKSVIPITHLQLAKREELFTQLKLDIYKKYARHELNQTSCNHISIFIHDVNAELKILETYLAWQTRIQYIACSKLFTFPFDVATIEEKKARLFFLLDILSTSQAEQS